MLGDEAGSDDGRCSGGSPDSGAGGPVIAYSAPTADGAAPGPCGSATAPDPSGTATAAGDAASDVCRTGFTAAPEIRCSSPRQG